MPNLPIVLAIHPEYADAILEGSKSFEIRRRCPDLPPGTLVYLYATSPISEIVGGFVLRRVWVGSLSATQTG